MRPAFARSLAAVVVLLSQLATAAPAWEAAPLSADPRQLLWEARALPVPEDAGVEVLIDQTRVTLDAQGRETRTRHAVIRVLTDEGARSWAQVGEWFSPWHEERPRVRARVITSDGKVHELDPQTLTEASATDEDPDVFTDRRVLRGPLPAIAPGAVVEQEVVLKQTAPLFPGGVTSRVFVGHFVPVRTWRLTLEAPAATPLRAQALGLKLEPKVTTTGGRRLIEFRVDGLAAVQAAEPLLPLDRTAFPHVAYSTGESWNAVAKAYANTVAQQLAGAQLTARAKEIVGAETRRDAVAQKLLGWLQHNVRYTGLELREAALVPRTPQETLSRRYGDCKDLSTVLVGMLRALGHPADVALLRVSPTEVPDGLPGIGQFDHAIVHVGGDPALWIDPTHDALPAGQLPVGAQGRLALLARADATGLIKTPESSAAENRVSITREFFLQERGESRAIERWVHTGWVAGHFRGMLKRSEPAQVREWLARYVQSAYSGELGMYEVGDLADPTRPFTLEIEILKARRGFTGEEDAAVAVLVAPVFEWFPEPLTAALKASEEGGDEGSNEEAPKRREGDLVHFEPHAFELRYLAHPPPGFRPKILPASGTRSFGPVTLNERFRELPDGSTEAAFALELRDRRLGASQVNAIREAVTELREQNARMLSFELTAAALLQQGQFKEALAEYRALAAAHPHEALHHEQLADALLAAGFGGEARSEARRAVALEPSSADAHRKLAWVLEHDLFGRRHRKGFDHAGALALYEQARKLDPRSVVTRASRAILLEYDARGVRYAPGARLDEAIAEYESIRTELKNKDWERNLLFAMFWARRFEALRALAPKVPQDSTRDALLLAAVIAEQGVEAGLDEANRLISSPETRRNTLGATVPYLMNLRLYPEASAVLQRIARGAPNSAALQVQASMLAKVKRHEEVPKNDADPRSVIQRMLIVSMGPEDQRSELTRLFSEHVTTDEDDRDQLTGTMAGFARSVEGSGMTLDNVIDVALGAIEMVQEGDDRSGWRIRSRAPLSGSAAEQLFYVVKEKAGYRIAAVGGAPPMLGEEAFRRVEANDLAGARRWLDWARELYGDSVVVQDLDPTDVFAALWTKGNAGSKQDVRLAAAALAALGEAPAKVIPVLEKARKGAPAATRLKLDLVLAVGHGRMKKHREALTAAERAIAAAPENKNALLLKLRALGQLERFKDYVKTAEQWLARHPDDGPVISALSMGHAHLGDFDAAERTGRRVVTLGKSSALDYNNLAWFSLFRGPATAAAIEDAQRATSLSRNQSAASLHTLATLYAETGNTTQARELLVKLLDLRPDDEADDGIRYVHGRIAEQYGLLGPAEEAYRSIRREEADGTPSLGSVYELAQRRLSAMKRGAPLVGRPQP